MPAPGKFNTITGSKTITNANAQSSDYFSPLKETSYTRMMPMLSKGPLKQNPNGSDTNVRLKDGIEVKLVPDRWSKSGWKYQQEEPSQKPFFQNYNRSVGRQFDPKSVAFAHNQRHANSIRGGGEHQQEHKDSYEHTRQKHMQDDMYKTSH